MFARPTHQNARTGTLITATTTNLSLLLNLALQRVPFKPELARIKPPLKTATVNAFSVFKAFVLKTPLLRGQCLQGFHV